MDWKDKIYTSIAENKKETVHTRISSLANQIQNMKKGPERSAKILQVQNLITAGRPKHGAIETALPKPPKPTQT